MTKRPTIKGKGADFFLEEKEIRYPEQRKATFYIPETLIDNLDSVWLDLRKTHRKLKKSDIARIAFEQLLRDYKENHQDSMLIEHLDVKTSKH